MTVVLALVTLAAVIVGGLAARSANETYRLEAEPILVVAKEAPSFGKPPPEEIPLARTYIVTGSPALANGLVLRRWQQNDEPTPVSGRVAYSGANQRPAAVLEFQNVGRSPALDVAVDVSVTVRVSYKVGQDAPGFEVDRDNQSDEWNRTGTQRGGGTIRLSAVPAQSKLSVRIENSIGLQVTLTPETRGRRVLWHKHKQPSASIAVLAPEGPFHIKAHDGIAPG